MKKILAIAFIGSLFAVSCSKKADKSLQDSNIMMEEPEVAPAADSTTKTTMTPAASSIPTPVPTDSVVTK